MSNEKKCSSCGEWSKWKNDLNDVCQHCGELLSPKELEEKIEKEELVQKQEREWVFNFESNASLGEKLFKTVGNYIYMAIMAIVSFIMYLFFWLGP